MKSKSLHLLYPYLGVIQSKVVAMFFGRGKILKVNY